MMTKSMRHLSACTCVCVGRLKESVAGDMTCQCHVGVSDTGVHTGHWHLFTHSLSLVLGK